jgi:beta-xylosidase
MINKLLLIFITFSISCIAIAQKNTYKSQVWVADNGNGTYKNPILNADYSDPDAIRVGDDYYMVASSFNCSPALPILHSKDLVNWKIINYALQKQIPLDVFDKPQHGKGVWAPAIRFHKGEFYIYYPDPDFGIYMIKTKNIAAEWSKPVIVLQGKGIIDPCPFWDEDGKAYLITGWAASRAGVNSLLTLYKMKPDGTLVIDEGKHVFDGHDNNKTIEGPKMYKRNGYYYIFAPAGGVGTGWQLVLRSKKIYGAYEEIIVMDQGTTNINGPHQGAWIDTKTGEDWFLHFQDKDAYGRVVHLQPMIWKNNWPIIGTDKDGDGKGQPVLVYKKPNVGNTYGTETPIESDEFNNDTLGLQWQWQANPKVQWSALMPEKKYLRLFAVNQEKDAVNLWHSANLLLQKFPAPNFTTTTKVTLYADDDALQNKKAGLVVMGLNYAYLSINKNLQGYYIELVKCTDAIKAGVEKIMNTKPITNSTVYLRTTTTAPDAICQFSYSEDGTNFIDIGEPIKAKEGRWIGAKIGLFCNGIYGSKGIGYADFDWFRITK